MTFEIEQIFSGEKPWRTSSPNQPPLWVQHWGSHCPDIQGLSVIGDWQKQKLMQESTSKENFNILRLIRIWQQKCVKTWVHFGMNWIEEKTTKSEDVELYLVVHDKI